MTTRDRIIRELDTLPEEDLSELYTILKQFIESKQRPASTSLMSRLRRVTIDAPADFATQLELYTSGEKRVD